MPFIQVLAPPLLAFLITLVAMPPYIGALKQRKIEQFLREEGPKSHAGKANTPTAGGALFTVMFVIACFVGLVLFGMDSPDSKLKSELVTAVSVVLAAVLCGAIGFMDDAAKIRQKSNAGIPGKVRLGLEAIVGLILGVMLLLSPLSSIGDPATSLSAGCYEFFFHQAPFLLIFLSIFLMMATTNSVNLHDGRDGLASGTSILAFLTLALLFDSSNQPVLTMVALTAAGAIGAFLVFNKNPAKIFMGDTGSLFIGGLMAGLVVASGMVVYFIPLSLIYIAEAISVMAQVMYFKYTKEYTPAQPMSQTGLVIYKLTHTLPGQGKRLLRMAPLHHHFEAVFAERGVSEAQVVVGFWVVQFALCTLVLAAWYTMH